MKFNNLTRSASFTLVLLLAATTACEQPHPHQRLNTPPQGKPELESKHQAFYKAMSDNALLADMAMYEMHFVPHQPLLTKAGKNRVKRYAELLKETGGTLAYESRQDDKKLNIGRLEAIRHCLAESNATTAPIKVALGTSGAEGMDANQAIAARQTGTTIPKPAASGSGSSSTTGTSSGGSSGSTSGAAMSGGAKE